MHCGSGCRSAKNRWLFRDEEMARQFSKRKLKRRLVSSLNYLSPTCPVALSSYECYTQQLIDIYIENVDAVVNILDPNMFYSVSRCSNSVSCWSSQYNSQPPRTIHYYSGERLGATAVIINPSPNPSSTPA